MSLCVNCQHYWSNGKGMDECTLHNQWTDSIKECDDFASKHKQTNADRIRSMTDEELSSFLDIATVCVCFPCTRDINDLEHFNNCKHENGTCEKEWFEWLKEEAKE